MTEPPLHIRPKDDIPRTRLIYPNGDTEELALAPVAPGLFRLEQSSILIEAYYHDLIGATLCDDGSLLFQDVAERSEFHTLSWLLPKTLSESEDLQAILSDVIEMGGAWERIFGGCLLVHVPPQHAREIEARVQGLNN